MLYQQIKPFIKWAGGKSQILDQIRKKYPPTITKYCEPFVGGGAVLLDVIANFQPKEVLINDINAELINVYQQIKENVEQLIEQLQIMEKEFSQIEKEDRKRIYISKRTLFNEIKCKNSIDYVAVCASLFIFLNKTCFNGLYRVNSKGLHNVPMGSYKNPKICDAQHLRLISKLLTNTEIKCGDYQQCLDFIDENTFVYFDPPYRPLTKTASFTAYDVNGFGDKQQKQLKEFIDKASVKKAHILASNSDPKNTDQNDNFFDDLYSGYIIQRIYAKRMINSNGDNRGKITELLISNY